jgi:hypothetical protein
MASVGRLLGSEAQGADDRILIPPTKDRTNIANGGYPINGGCP